MSSIPKPVKKVLKPIYYNSKSLGYKILDLYDIIKGHKNSLIPPRSMIFVGDGNYEKIGNEFFNYFKELGNLKPSHKVLDVGCGIGRMAVPLTSFLSKDGEYFGFDIVEKGIIWSKDNITAKYPNFHFLHSDIYNKSYNPKGTEKSSEYNFQYDSNFFDFVFLTSVFTHMESADVEHYLKEISRVMKSGSRCLITFFIINDESKRFIEKGASSQNLIYQIDEISFVKDKLIPESAIGYREEYLVGLFTKSRLKINSINYGSWCGREKYLSYQDIIIAQK